MERKQQQDAPSTPKRRWSDVSRQACDHQAEGGSRNRSPALKRNVFPLFAKSHRQIITEQRAQSVMEYLDQDTSTQSQECPASSSESSSIGQVPHDQIPAAAGRADVVASSQCSSPELNLQFHEGERDLLKDLDEALEETLGPRSQEIVGGVLTEMAPLFLSSREKPSQACDTSQYLQSTTDLHGGQVEGAEADTLSTSSVAELDDSLDCDDEVGDPNWVSARGLGVSRRNQHGQSEHPVGQQHPTAEISVASTRRHQSNPGKSSQKKYTRVVEKSSPAWEFFTVHAQDESNVVCNICSKVVSRGQKGSGLGTSGLRSHLRVHHSRAFEWVKRVAGTAAKARPPLPPSSLWPIPIQPAQSKSCPIPSSGQAGTGYQSTSSEFGSPESQVLKRQASFPEMMQRKRMLPANDKFVVKNNGLLAKLLAQQLLPYNFVDSAPFRRLMTSVAPQWRIPSRRYFSRKAMPALHQHMLACVARSMDHAVGGKVHFTTDAWSSRHGQGKYITYTAHWVTLHHAVDGARSRPVSQRQLVVPPRGVKGRPAPLPSATCSVSGQVAVQPPGKQFCSYSGMQHHRCQAMLQLVSMEEKRQTGSEILRALEDQIRQWLTPRKLQTGIIVSDNGSNMLAAIRLGDYTHLPCLAHVFNLIVNKFLGTFEGLKDAVSTARKVSAHIRRSATASASLKLLQRRHNLPQHRLICDCPTRWNSTLHMLERLWEQRMAVRIYLSETASSTTLSLDYITGDQWEKIGQVCQVLEPFEQATKLVSMEHCNISQVLPIVFMLDKMLFKVLGRGEKARLQSAQANVGVPEHAQAQEEDKGEAEVGDDEDEEEAIVRGWEDIDVLLEHDDDSSDNSPQEEMSSSRHLFPMAAHMIKCLKNDPRIKNFKSRLDMWVATMLDPRCKGKMRQFIAPSQADSMMTQIRETLVRWVEDAFPAPRATVYTPGQNTQQSSGGPSSTKTSQSENLLSMMYDFYQPESSDAPPCNTSTTSSNSSHRQRLNHMVSDYLGSASAADSMETNDPMEYWTKKLDTWPELSQYALEVLACPASSVLSERVFSAAGGVVTDNRTRLSAENVDRLTFIKMNESWIIDDFDAPLIDS